MADVVDIANDYAQAEIDSALKARQAKEIKESSDTCIECGYEIPSERQVVVPGCQLCVSCAEELEDKRW